MFKKRSFFSDIIFAFALLFFSLAGAAEGANELIINRFDVNPKTIPTAQSTVDFTLIVTQQDQNLDCSYIPGSGGNFRWSVWYDSPVRSVLVADGGTPVPYHSRQLNLSFIKADFQPREGASFMDFKARVGCSSSWISRSAEANDSGPVRVLVSGASGGGGQRPPTSGTTQDFSFTVPNFLAINPQPQNVFQLIFAVTSILLNIAGTLVVILIIYSGVRFVISRGNPGEIGKAKTILWWAIAGFAVVVVGKGFVFLIESVLRGS